MSGIKSNQMLTAKYSLNSAANVNDVAYTITSSDTVTLTVTVKGKGLFVDWNYVTVGKTVISKTVTVVK